LKISRLLLATITLLVLVSGVLPLASADLTTRAAIPDVIIAEDETAWGRINLYDHFSDDGGWLHFSSLSADNKIAVTINEDGSVDFSAPKDWYGKDEVTFIASNGQQQASDTILVTVEPINDPVLVLTPFPDITFKEDGGLKGAMNLNTHFQDIDSTMSFSYSSEFIMVKINDNGYVDFYAPNDWYGTEWVTFSASDGEFVATKEVLVTVTPENDAPRCCVNIASIGLNTDQRSITMELKDYFTDVDDDVLSYKIVGNQGIKAELNAEQGQLVLKAPEDWSGEEILTLTATDSSGEASSVQIVVIATRGTDSSGQVFYLLGLVLAVAIVGVRLQFAGRKRIQKSPVKLSNYRYYKGH
jgi:hypothetical protein